MQWRNDTAEDMKETGGYEHRVPACFAHARVTSHRSDGAGDSGVMLSSWQNCKPFTSFSPFVIKTDVISLFKLRIYMYIYIYLFYIYICYIRT